MNKREFIKKSSLGALGVALAPSFLQNLKHLGPQARLRTAHIGLGYQGIEDLRDIASHPQVEVVALCDVDSNNLAKALALHPGAKGYKDYRTLLADMKDQIDAVVVATPDHSHAPVAMLAMEMDKPVYCQKPLTHYVSESRAMKKLAAEKGLVTQMGIQVHSFYDYMLATLLIPIAGYFQIFDGLQVVAAGVLRGAGDTRAPLVVNIVGFWCLGLPTSLVLAFGLGYGPRGLWWGLVVGLGVVAIFLISRVAWKLRGSIARVVVE